MIERYTNQVVTPNGHSDESALWYLNRYAQLSGLEKPLGKKDIWRAAEKFKKDLYKIAINEEDSARNTEAHIVSAPKTILEAGGYRLFWEESIVVKPNGEKVKLSFTESNVLYLLMSKPDRIVRYKEFRKVWPNTEMEELKINTRLYIHYLREKLGDTCLSKPGHRRNEWSIIKTIERRGYLLPGNVRDNSDHLLDAGF